MVKKALKNLGKNKMKQKLQLYAIVDDHSGSYTQIFKIIGITYQETKYPILVKNGKLFVEIDRKDTGEI